MFLPFLLPCSCSDTVLCGITIFKGGTLGAESEHFDRSSSLSDSGGAGVLVFVFVELEIFEGFGLLAIEELLGLFLSLPELVL